MKDKNPSVRQSTEMLGMFVTAVRPTLTDILYVWCGGGEGRPERGGGDGGVIPEGLSENEKFSGVFGYLGYPLARCRRRRRHC